MAKEVKQQEQQEQQEQQQQQQQGQQQGQQQQQQDRPVGAPSGGQQAAHQQQQQQQFPVVAPSTVVNIAAHSLLMLTVPFALFFAATLGALDPVFSLAGASPPRQEVRSYLGAGLAVVGVNLVIASFVVQAFREDDGKAGKQD